MPNDLSTGVRSAPSVVHSRRLIAVARLRAGEDRRHVRRKFDDYDGRALRPRHARQPPPHRADPPTSPRSARVTRMASSRRMAPARSEGRLLMRPGDCHPRAQRTASQLSSPRSHAARANAVRLETPTLINADSTWDRAVRTEIPRALAISSLGQPRDTRPTTSSSRGVRPAGGSVRLSVMRTPSPPASARIDHHWPSSPRLRNRSGGEPGERSVATRRRAEASSGLSAESPRRGSTRPGDT